MKRWMIILIGGLFLAGCTNEETFIGVEKPYTINAQADYVEDREMINGLETLKKVIGKTNSEETNQFEGVFEENIWNWFNERATQGATEDYERNNGREELSQNIRGAYLFSCKLLHGENTLGILEYSVIDFIDEELLPGLKAYLAEQEKDTTDLHPRATVMNNCVIIYTPVQLYNAYGKFSYSYEGNGPFNIYFYPYQLTNVYHKKLVQAVDASQFVVFPPIKGEEESYLQLSTPFFIVGTQAQVTEGDKQTFYYGENGISYGLYTKEDSIEKIRMTIKLHQGQTIEKGYFDALKNWGKTELNFGEKEFKELEDLIDWCCIGKTGRKNGRLGEYTYSYKVVDDNIQKMNEEKLIEVVIHK